MTSPTTMSASMRSIAAERGGFPPAHLMSHASPGTPDRVEPIDVVAAVIRRPDGAVLLSLRRPDQHQGGLWEFPGGKRSRGEAPLAALARELEEELGLRLDPAHVRPLIQLTHHYPEKSVKLTVWEVFAWTGEPIGREGQEIAWVAQRALASLALPAANYRILAAASLPRLCLVTPEPDSADETAFLAGLEASLGGGIRLVQLRVKSLALSDVLPLARRVIARCHHHGARVLLNAGGDPTGALLAELGADGVHLPSSLLHQYRERPLAREHLLSVACHGMEDIQQASRLGADLGLLGPVLPTQSHPGAPTLGWEAAAELARYANFPLFALGGQGPHSVEAALAAGFHGIAAITGLWNRQALPDARLRPPG